MSISDTHQLIRRRQEFVEVLEEMIRHCESILADEREAPMFRGERRSRVVQSLAALQDHLRQLELYTDYEPMEDDPPEILPLDHQIQSPMGFYHTADGVILLCRALTAHGKTVPEGARQFGLFAQGEITHIRRLLRELEDYIGIRHGGGEAVAHGTSSQVTHKQPEPVAIA